MMPRRMIISVGLVCVLGSAVLFFRGKKPQQSIESIEHQFTSQANEGEQTPPVNETDIPEELIRVMSDHRAVKPGPANRLAALFTDDGIVQPLSREQIDQWLSLNKSNAASLLAAAQLSGDLSLLHVALTNFPNDPRVLLTAAHRCLNPNASYWTD